MKLSPKDYKYLWTDHEVNFIFTSCYLFPKFIKQDFVLIYDWKTKGLEFFLSKNDHQKLAEEGITFYQNKFTKWKEDILSQIKKGKELIIQTNNEKTSSLTPSKLKQLFQERVQLFQELGELYFYTEFFVVKKAEKMAKLSSKLKKMGTIKLRARKVLNHFYNYHQIFQPYIEEMGKRTLREDLMWLSHQEIIKILNGKNIPPSNRDKTYWILAKKNQWELLQGKETEEIMLAFHRHFFEQKNKQLSGTIANSGKYQGTVKVIRTLFSDSVKQEILKVKKGEVLIANTTGPEIISACQRAGAIVTDEGGLTSHAAIISRELKIPCIVGTKIATKTFKDGDKVVVDANKGIVFKV